MLLAALLLVGCRRPAPTELPAPVWAEVEVRTGTRTVVEEQPTVRPARLPTERGLVVVEPFEVASGVSLAPGALGEALRRWVDEHADAIAERMGDRCGERDPCLAIRVLAPPIPPTAEPEAEPPPAGETGVAESPAPPQPEASAPRAPPAEADYVLRGRVLEVDVYEGRVRAYVEAVAPGADEPALSGTLEAPTLEAISARVGAAFLPEPGVRRVERQVPVTERRRQVVRVERRPVTTIR